MSKRKRNANGVDPRSLIWLLVVTSLTLISSLAFGESGTTQSNRDSQAEFFGRLATKPSYITSSGEVFYENQFEVGVQVRENLRFSYFQYVMTAESEQNQFRIEPQLFDGYFQARVNNVWKQKKTSLNWNPRVYLPTHPAKRDAGMITAIRNNFTLTNQLTDRFSISFTETPIVHVYNRTGFHSEGTNIANPVFENRLVTSFNFNLGSGVTLSFPILFFATRFQNFQPGATNNDVWSHYLAVNPEIYFAITDNLTIGLGYLSNNMIGDQQFGGLVLGESWKEGTFNLFFGLTL